MRRWFHEQGNPDQCQMKENWVKDRASREREQMLAEAKPETQKYEAKASFDEKYIRNLKSQIDTRDWDLGRALAGYMEISQAIDRLQQGVADRERALQEDRLREIQEMEFKLMNSQEQNYRRIRIPTTASWTKVRELQCEINYMHDSKDFKDAESMHSGQLSHVPGDSALFPHQDERRDLLVRAKSTPPDIWNTPFTSGTFFQVHLHILRHPTKGCPHHGTIQMKNVWEDLYGATCSWGWWWRKKRNTNSEISKKFVDRKFIRPYQGKKLYELWSWPTKTSNPRTSRWQVPYSTDVSVLENKVQDGSMLLLKLHYGGYVMGQRSRDCYFSGRFEIFAIH